MHLIYVSSLTRTSLTQPVTLRAGLLKVSEMGLIYVFSLPNWVFSTGPRDGFGPFPPST